MKIPIDFVRQFKKICDEVISQKGQINIVLSGGSTPKTLFAELAKNYKDKIKWNKVNFYWADERCVDPDDKESNFGMTKEILLKNISIPEDNIHRIKGENNPEKEAIRYSELIKKNIPARNGLPSFDLTLLGMGEDGHTASIFPNRMQLLNSDKICEVVFHPETNQKRVTLTGKILNNSERIYFLISGKSKEKIFEKIIERKDDYLRYPAAHIENAVWVAEF